MVGKSQGLELKSCRWFEAPREERAAWPSDGQDSNTHQVTLVCTSKRKGTKEAILHVWLLCAQLGSRPLAASQA